MKKLLRGVAASPGIGIGSALVYREGDFNRLERDVEDSEAENRRYRDAVDRFCSLREQKAAYLSAAGGQAQADILLTQVEMVRDPYLSGQVEGRIASYRSAEAALDEVCGIFVRQFLKAENEYTRLRAEDIRDMRNGVLRQLLGIPEADFSQMEKGTVIVAEDLPPSVMAALDPEVVAGIVLCRGGRASHTSILARAMGIPTVVGANGALSWVVDGEEVAVDGIQGEAVLEPNDSERAALENLRKNYIGQKKSLDGLRGRETLTSDGVRVSLMATVGSESESLLAREDGCDGIGLLRSEFLYLDRPSLPKEEEQFQVYRRIAQQAGGKPVVIRTLDVGGEKRIPGISYDWEENPVLGCRGVRLSLVNPDFTKEQLRAILRAGVYGNVRILLPMVTGIEEIRGMKALIEEAKDDLRARRISFRADLPLGIMVETVAAALTADRLAKEADFFSIGMNDLTQYTMAVDRDNAAVATLYSHYDPSLLRLLKWTVDSAADAGCPVSFCGQAAADPLFIPLLLGLGIEQFSVQPMSLLASRRVFSLWTKEESAELLNEAMTLSTETEVHALLKSRERI